MYIMCLATGTITSRDSRAWAQYVSSGLYMARHEAGSHEARHTSCAPSGPRAFTWQVCQPASQTNHSLAVDHIVALMQ